VTRSIGYCRFVISSTAQLIVAAVGGGQGLNTQAISLERSIPQGEGVGYTFTGGHVGGDGSDGAFGRAFVQANAAHVTVGAEYSRASRPEAGPSLSQVFVAGTSEAGRSRGAASRRQLRPDPGARVTEVPLCEWLACWQD
jgi:hypothetical protein